MKLCSEADIERVRRMELAFDQALCALKRGKRDVSLSENIRMLEDYVSSGQWLGDYEMDERGCFPEELKRGVLSQDALYDLLRRNDKEGETI